MSNKDDLGLFVKCSNCILQIGWRHRKWGFKTKVGNYMKLSKQPCVWKCLASPVGAKHWKMLHFHAYVISFSVSEISRWNCLANISCFWNIDIIQINEWRKSLHWNRHEVWNLNALLALHNCILSVWIDGLISLKQQSVCEYQHTVILEAHIIKWFYECLLLIT